MAGSSVAADRSTAWSPHKNAASEQTIRTKDHNATPSGNQLELNWAILYVNWVVAPTPAAPATQPQHPNKLTMPKHHNIWISGNNSPCSEPSTGRANVDENKTRMKGF